MIKILTIFIQDTRPAGPKTRNNDNPDYHQNLRFAPLGCPAMFRRARPQPRLQHEARCWFVDSWFGLHLLVLVTKWQQGGWALFATGETRPIVGGRLQNRFTHCRHWNIILINDQKNNTVGVSSWFCLAKAHLESEHGSRLARVEQEEGRSVKLSQVIIISFTFLYFPLFFMSRGLGVIHILRNHFWGSRQTPPPLCNL